MKHLLFCFLVFFVAQFALAQTAQPTSPELRHRLQQYVADNHLPPGGWYMYWDTTGKKPIKFNAKDFTVEDLSKPVLSKAASSVSTANRLLGSAGNFHLVKDINTLTDANPVNYITYNSNPPYAVVNNVSYFSADDGIHGRELWRSDGTTAGTYLVKDILSGTTGSYPVEIIVSNNSLYFLAYTATSAYYSLWKSDGTEAGTIEVADFADRQVYSPAYLCDVNGIIYFTVGHNAYNEQLWKTDGTPQGTVMVKDLSIEGGSNLRNFVAAGGLLYFVANTTNEGDELWRSNGTDTGTFMLKDINPDVFAYHGPSRLTSYNDHLYFSENDSDGYSKLWQTDGTTQGTVLAEGYDSNLQLINNFSNFNMEAPFTISSNYLYFSASMVATGEGLYKYNPSEGAVLVKDINLGSGKTSLYADQMTDVNGTVYFVLGGSELYRTNGTADSTLLLKSFTVYPNISSMANGNGKLYFVKQNDIYSYEPWISDGTPEGTVLLQNIYSATESGRPTSFTACNGKVLFSATDSLHGNELWVTNGSTTQLLTDINITATANASPSQITAFKNGVIMSATTFTEGIEPWVSDGLDATLVKDFSPGHTSSYPSYLLVKNGFAYFMATTSLNNFASAYNVYKTDGTTPGTSQVTFITLDHLMNLFDFTVTDDGTIFYAVYNYSTNSNEIWKTDGTAAGTMVVKSGIGFDQFNIDRNGFFFGTRNLISAGNIIYFKAFALNATTGTELWRSDGTTAGTYIVKDINPATYGGSQVSVITAFNNQVYFDAFDGTKTALWTSDGTTAGTIKLKDAVPSEFKSSNNTLFFSGKTDSAGTELWKTDGTITGTIQVKDIYSGSSGSIPASLTDVKGTLFFSATDPEHGNELWKSDGTAAGTQLVKDITPGTLSTFYDFGNDNFTTAAGKLFFDYYGQIWVSDGTNEGTGAIAMDNELNITSINDLTGNGNQLFFGGYDYKHGYELYVGDAAQVVLPVNLVAFTASLQNTDVIAQWQTTTEPNTAYFNIQHSTDGVHFTSIGKVAATGNSNTLQQYSFTDVNIVNLVAAKTIYYRLEIADKNGAITYSKVVPVDLKWKDVVVILHPNPVKEVLKIRINNYAGNAIVDLYDVSGKKLRSLQRTIQSGSDIAINTSFLPTGVYVAKLNLNGNIIQQKFVKE